ncbi:nicotinate-nucleotide adenylyltransferase [Halovulum marinum]|uniref:nicotinate-nucleotide adenylyltransferase n=1 Tax=Halovulum marinum TaxID=2662447 RepID=UPI002D76DE7E|nr:nicotinate-nucleotide adenylyltransferase [Halovulum marinum]
MRQGYPKAAAGLKVGLLGGSFDPPHLGHVHITRRALRRFDLDQVWWLLSPGNPLKPDAPAAMARRLHAARALVRHPRVQVTDIEARLGTRYTADTLRRLAALYPGVSFVWLMGADNLAGFHRWEKWRDIMEQVPIGVLARPGEQVRAGLSPAARGYARWRLPKEAAPRLALARPPAWLLLSGPMVEASSTALRRAGAWIR